MNADLAAPFHSINLFEGSVTLPVEATSNGVNYVNAGQDICPPGSFAADTSYVPVFWYVRASWLCTDQTARFLSEGIWENNYPDVALLETVRRMRPGERIAINTLSNRKKNLPFISPRPFVSVMPIRAIGTIKANPGDGRRLDVQWEQPFGPPREWYFYTYFEKPIWGLSRDKDRCIDFLIDFTFNGQQQDYPWFLSQPAWSQPPRLVAATRKTSDGSNPRALSR